ncbi:MAG: DUF1343 domain-containing protein [Deltaproteobacteria bacterium]|nr:DUF1343 domain-containing protein [Deltaproteobacteria bacterium]
MIRLGNEGFIENAAATLRGRRVGLVANATSFTPRMASLLRFCEESSEVRLAAVFAPEHGVAGLAQDMESVGGGRLASGVPVFSLYGADPSSLSPPDEAMDLVDVVVFDLQDVGTRYYTFLWTMALCQKTCAEHGRELIVLDRPNPLGGEVVSGPVQREGFTSFVGLYPVPVRHGLTAGEMARFLAAQHGLDAPLTVVPMRGWRRAMRFEETGLPWIPPSPNMPSPATAAVYPGGCLIEGTTLSEGRGTTTPFEQFGAPGIDAVPFADALRALDLAGCAFRPVTFRPAFQKHAGHACGGVYVHVTDRRAFDAFAVYAHALALARRLFPDAWTWRREAYEFVRDIPAIDLLYGSDALRKRIDEGGLVDDLVLDNDDTEAFRETRRAFLLYE